jgi:YbbR domain-containing protein
VFSTSEVTVSGQEELVNQVDHAAVILSEKGLEDTWKGKLPLILVDSDGNELSQEELTLSESEVDVVFPVSHVKKIQLAVTIVEGGGATAEDVSYTVKPDTLTVSGTNEDLEKLDTFNVGTVDLADVVTSEKTSFAIELPDGISNVSGTTVAVVDLTIDSSLVTRRVTTSDIRLVNVPENVTAQLVTDTLEVRIRGRKSSMNLLDQGDVYAEVDLSDIPEDAYGNFTLVAKVKVKGMSDVGAVGTDEVVVNLS